MVKCVSVQRFGFVENGLACSVYNTMIVGKSSGVSEDRFRNRAIHISWQTPSGELYPNASYGMSGQHGRSIAQSCKGCHLISKPS